MFLQLGLDLLGQVLEEWVRDLRGGFFGEFLLGVWRLSFGGMDDIQASEEKEGKRGRGGGDGWSGKVSSLRE